MIHDCELLTLFHCPAAQTVQEPRPVLEPYCPTAQAAHGELPPGEKKPGECNMHTQSVV